MSKHHRNAWFGIGALVLADLVILTLMVIFVVPHIGRVLGVHTGSSVSVKNTKLVYSAGPGQVAPSPTASPSRASGGASTQVLGSATTPRTTVPVSSRYIGAFISDVPGESGANQTLDALAGMGMNVAYNYSFTDGSPAGIRSYLAYAHSKGIKIIVGLDNLYGPNDEATALQIVRDYGTNPAVWGFGIADEKPEGPSDSAQWMPIVTTRYQRVKQLTSKPVMAIAVGWSSPDNGARASFLRSFAPATDVLAIDNYPIPYYGSGGITSLLQDGPSNRERWFIPQAFSWASYPDTAQGLGYNLSQARYPTAGEMESMARQALAGGASGILFYSYFDIKNSAAQVSSLTQVVRSLGTK